MLVGISAMFPMPAYALAHRGIHTNTFHKRSNVKQHFTAILCDNDESTTSFINNHFQVCFKFLHNQPKTVDPILVARTHQVLSFNIHTVKAHIVCRLIPFAAVTLRSDHYHNARTKRPKRRQSAFYGSSTQLIKFTRCSCNYAAIVRARRWLHWANQLMHTEKDVKF